MEENMLSWVEILIRLILASAFGAFIGLERERKDWTAGMRTHMMVCVGSCLIMLVSGYGFNDLLNNDKVELDPSRVAAQVVSGIGFIGAGTILFLQKGIIRGLTTASGLWTVAAIGLATGGGMYFAAAATTIIALIILWAMQPIEKFYAKKFKHKTLRLVAQQDPSNNELLKSLLTKEDLEVQTFTLERNAFEFVLQIKFDDIDANKIDLIMEELKQNESIKEIHWT